MTYTDTQLKQALAKMLPGEIYIDNKLELRWIGNKSYQPHVLSTELLHLCWLVEQALLDIEFAAYQEELNGILSFNQRIASAPWDKRVIALAKVKGVEIV